jgi:LysR family glycine cleavage system transcriptional activator
MASRSKPQESPSRRLPPLNALRAFEAAARHLSFALAARELHVTPAAISHQVKGLEEHLGTALFRRLARGLELTRAGRACLPGLSEGFDRMADAVEQVRALENARVLAVSAAPSFATRWLAPRLHRFVGAHPHLDVRINASTQLIDPSKGDAQHDGEVGNSTLDDADIAIRFGSGDYPGFRVDKLLAASVTPVCSPQLLKGERPLREPADLKHHVLIHDNVSSDDGRALWQVWLEAAGVEGVDVSHGLRFNHAMLALEAAADGLGVALGMPVLAAADLAAGRLVQPFELVLPLRFGYYAVSTSQASSRPDVAAFRDWLLAEAAKS